MAKYSAGHFWCSKQVTHLKWAMGVFFVKSWWPTVDGSEILLNHLRLIFYPIIQEDFSFAQVLGFLPSNRMSLVLGFVKNHPRRGNQAHFKWWLRGTLHLKPWFTSLPLNYPISRCLNSTAPTKSIGFPHKHTIGTQASGVCCWKFLFWTRVGCKWIQQTHAPTTMNKKECLRWLFSVVFA